MKLVKHLLDDKGRDVLSIPPDATVLDAVKRMAEVSVGALLVMDGDRVVGIISERDYARKVILKGRSSKDTQVREIMTPRVICIAPESRVEDAMALMTDKRVRHLPVLVDNRVDGMISIGDVVRAVIAEQEFQIELLEKYIQGG